MEASSPPAAGGRLSFFRRLFSSNLPNPGKFEDINAEARKIFQIETFEGIRMEYQRGLNNSFGVSHVAHLGASADAPHTYEFCANYSQDKLSKNPHQSSAVAQLDYKGSDWFGQLKMGSFAQWGLSYLQSVTKNLSLGLDFTYLGRPPYNNPPVSIQTGGLRYSNDKFVLIAQLLSSGQVQASYTQRIRDNLSFGTEFGLNAADGSSSCAVGYEYSSSLGNFKTNLTTEGKITSYLEKALAETTMLTMCVELDHRKQACKYGVGLQVMT